jgi:3-phenylpropionate/cinnamic acid dioxygenase small subunit
MNLSSIYERLIVLNSEYARCINSDQLEKWPDFFQENCLYKITTAANVKNGFDAGIIYADSKAMLADRINALRNANIYERQRYRHILGLPYVVEDAERECAVQTPFVVIRIMGSGQMELFASGEYRDRVTVLSADELKFAERIVVCDGDRFDTLLAIPL